MWGTCDEHVMNMWWTRDHFPPELQWAGGWGVHISLMSSLRDLLGTIESAWCVLYWTDWSDNIKWWRLTDGVWQRWSTHMDTTYRMFMLDGHLLLSFWCVFQAVRVLVGLCLSLFPVFWRLIGWNHAFSLCGCRLLMSASCLQRSEISRKWQWLSEELSVISWQPNKATPSAHTRQLININVTRKRQWEDETMSREDEIFALRHPSRSNRSSSSWCFSSMEDGCPVSDKCWTVERSHVSQIMPYTGLLLGRRCCSTFIYLFLQEQPTVSITFPLKAYI